MLQAGRQIEDFGMYLMYPSCWALGSVIQAPPTHQQLLQHYMQHLLFGVIQSVHLTFQGDLLMLVVKCLLHPQLLKGHCKCLG